MCPREFQLSRSITFVKHIFFIKEFVWESHSIAIFSPCCFVSNLINDSQPFILSPMQCEISNRRSDGREKLNISCDSYINSVLKNIFLMNVRNIGG